MRHWFLAEVSTWMMLSDAEGGIEDCSLATRVDGASPQLLSWLVKGGLLGGAAFFRLAP